MEMKQKPNKAPEPTPGLSRLVLWNDLRMKIAKSIAECGTSRASPGVAHL